MIRKNIKKGFSLVELLVVITIIAILSVTAYMAVGGYTIKARDSKRQDDLNTIQQALELYFIEFSKYPDALVSGTANGEIPKKYLSEIPKDPGTKSNYIYVASGSTYALGATLEGDGNIPNYKAYIVTNSDSDLIKANSSGVSAKFCSDCSGTPALGDCSGAYTLASGTIRDNKNNADGSGSCIPYSPIL